MGEKLEEFKKGKAFKFLKFLGWFLILVVLFNIYSVVFLRKSVSNLDRSSDTQKATVGISSSNGVFSSPIAKRSMIENTVTDSMMPMESMESSPAIGGVSPGVDSEASTLQTDKKVIKNGFLTLKVESTNGATNKISEIIATNGGEIFSSNFNEYTRGSRSGTITVKVPVANFQKTIVELKTVATQVINESTSGQDVTEQYVDLQAQLKNKKAEEQTFVSLLDRAGKLDDVLSVSREIARVRGDIERLEGKIKYLESQTDMSTITINISEDIEVTPISDDWRPSQVVKKAVNDLKVTSQNFVDGMIHFFIVTIPSLIPFIVFLVVIYWVGKKIYVTFIRK